MRRLLCLIVTVQYEAPRMDAHIPRECMYRATLPPLKIHVYL